MNGSRKSRLNVFRVGRLIGGAVVPGAHVGFGNFPLLQTTSDLLAARPEAMPDIDFSDSDDDLIIKAFEELRQGFAVDRFLADPALVKRFNRLCRQLGLRQPPDTINRRLLALRKRAGGGVFEPTTHRERHDGLVERFGAGVEPAMTKLRVLTGATVDDILADPSLGQEFERIASSIAPGGDPVEYRLCALQIRKNRHLNTDERSLFEQLDSDDVIDQFRDFETRRRSARAVPQQPGILLLQEGDRPLYLSKHLHIRDGAGQLTVVRFVKPLAADSAFWRPDPKNIRLRYITAEALGEHPLNVWELRLIRDLNPAFNWPVKIRAA